MLGAGCCMLNRRGDTLSEVEMYTLVEREARMQVKSLKNTLAKKKKAALLDIMVARLSDV